MSFNEGALLKKFLVEYTKLGSRLFRFQSGNFWAGKSIGPFKERQAIMVNPGDVLIKKARRIKVGFPGLSDTLGWTNITITPEMVGRQMAIFTAAEVKTKGVRTTKKQQQFVDAVNFNGGIGLIARKLEDLLAAKHEFETRKENADEIQKM